jgi:adenosine deaminase
VPPDAASTRSTWQSLPKIDLHRHLEGSIPFDLAYKLAKAGRVPLPSEKKELLDLITIAEDAAPSPTTFLAPFEHIRRLFQDEGTIAEAAKAVVAAAFDEGVRYLELHLTPAALAAASGASLPQATQWACRALQREAMAKELTLKIIISINRHEGIELGEHALQAALDMMEEGVVGIDLAGDESRFNGHEFKPMLHRAKEAGLKVSIHAGEWAGPESVAYALHELGADRIIHGVRIMEDEELVREARDLRVPFVVCLTSNLQSGVVDSLEQHPLPLMMAAGLQLSLGTDDPALSRTNLNKEFALAQEHLGMGFDSLRGMTMAGVQAAFAEEKERGQLERTFQKWLGLAPGTA